MIRLKCIICCQLYCAPSTVSEVGSESAELWDLLILISSQPKHFDTSRKMDISIGPTDIDIRESKSKNLIS